MGNLSTQLRAFADKAMGNADKVIRTVVLDLGTSIVERNPVGDPTLWKINTEAAAQNKAASETNAQLRADPANLTKAGRLKKGLKVQPVTIKAPEGYVGGRSRNSWMYSFGAPDNTQPHPMSEEYKGDQTGSESKARLNVLKSPQHGAFGVHYISNNLPYMHRLEFEGWSKQAPAGMVRVSVAEFQQFLTAAVESLPK
jgi:hypothetical protein